MDIGRQVRQWRSLAGRPLNGVGKPSIDVSPAAAVDLGYRLILGRPPEAAARESILREMSNGRTAGDIWASIAASPEFAARVTHQESIIRAAQRPDAEGLIDVAELGAAKSLEAHNESAERYFSSTDASFVEGHLAKPFGSAVETPELLTCFGHVVSALRLVPGLTVLDFAVGTGWTSWYFTQLGCQVIASDVSVSALNMARQRFDRWPPAGDRPEPRFLQFDGRRIDLEDASVDRICCFDAFHHVLNQADVMAEFARVLKPGGLVAFDEPGPHHSMTDGAQYEMREFGVVEGDIDLTSIDALATSCGLEFVAADILTVSPVWASLTEFVDLIETRTLSASVQQRVAQQISNKQLFVLRRAGTEVRDSRDRDGLSGTVSLSTATVVRSDAGEAQVELDLEVWNSGARRWLPSQTLVGGVSVGLRGLGGTTWERRVPIVNDRCVEPGERIKVRGIITVPVGSAETLTLGLVSELISWFYTSSIPMTAILSSAEVTGTPHS